ncbi:MAG TPA: PRC-barrel domain-containing protein [Chloroflexota bacterium]|nr:PRC-barrel domain-containing protein [Chloroflexota bacterium]
MIAPGPVTALDVRSGSEVYSTRGERLGTVAEVWAYTSQHGHLPRSHRHLAGYGPIAGNTSWFETSEGYLEVTEVLGPRLRRSHFIPLSDVLNMHGDLVVADIDGSKAKSARQSNRFNRAA